MSTTLDETRIVPSGVRGGHESDVTRRSCRYCGEYWAPGHTCDTLLRCGSCNEPRVIKADKDDLAGQMFGCNGCGATNIVPTPPGAGD